MAKNKYTDIDLSKYDKGYQASNNVKTAQKLKEEAEQAVRNYGDFQYGNEQAYQSAMDAILNREAFSYDLNGDALYQQYKDNYMAMGKQAMIDTVGQASALTGGYGNSYAATVGNQAYQGYLQQLNNVIPDLYNLALSAYGAESDRLNNNYSLLAADRSTQYGEWADKKNSLISDRGYYADNYNNAYAQDYTMWNDNRTYDTNQYWSEYDAGYQAERDAIADAQWQKNYDLSAGQLALSQKQFAYNQWLDQQELERSLEVEPEIPEIDGFTHEEFSKFQTELNQYAQDGDLTSIEARLNYFVDRGKLSESEASKYYKQYKGIIDENNKKSDTDVKRSLLTGTWRGGW